MIKKLRNPMVCSTILYNIKGPQCAKYRLEVEDTRINRECWEVYTVRENV